MIFNLRHNKTPNIRVKACQSVGGKVCVSKSGVHEESDNNKKVKFFKLFASS